MSWLRQFFDHHQHGPYHYQRRRLPGAGVQNYAFLDLSLDYFSPIGAATQIHEQPLIINGAPYLPPDHLIGISGIGGVEVVYPQQITPTINTTGQMPGGFVL